MKESEVIEIVGMLVSAYSTSKLDAAAAQIYRKLLIDLPADVTRQAVTRLLTTSKWVPTIAEIRSAATDLRLGPARTGGEAWAEAIGAIRTVGIYGVPKWTDPVLAEALRLWGSWRSFCCSPEDDPGGRARFIEMYEQLAARTRADVVSGIPLPAPRSAPQLVAPRPRPKADPAQLVEAVGRVVPPRPVSAFAGKRLSAEEIEAAMEVAS